MRLLTALALLVSLCLLPASALAETKPETMLFIEITPDLSGKVDVLVRKSYSGAQGPFEDVFMLPMRTFDRYGPPHFTTTGSVSVTYDRGNVRVDSEQGGPGTLEVAYTGQLEWGERNGFRSYSLQWLIQQMLFKEVGPVRMQVTTYLPPGAMLDQARSGIRVLVPHSEEMHRATFHPSSWTVDLTLDPASPAYAAFVELGFRVRSSTAPAWTSSLTLALSGAALLLAIHTYRMQKAGR